MIDTSRSHNGARLLGLAVLFALLVVVMTAPAIFDLSHTLIGNNVDNWIFYWNNWWLGKALAEGHDLFYTPYLYYPEGTSLVAHSNSFTSSLLALLLTPLTGPVAAYNLVVLLGLWIGCLGMYFLVRDLTRDSAAALVAAWVFTFAPYRLTQVLSHAHLGSLHWWPFFALFLHRCLRKGRRRDAVLAGIAFGLNLWTGLQLAVMIAAWAVLYVLHWAVAQSALVLNWRKAMRDVATQAGPGGMRAGWATLRLLALMVAVICILSLPLLIPIIRGWRASWTEDFDLSSRDQTDLLAYVVPPTYNPVLGPSVEAVYERFVANRAYMPYLGLAAVILLLLALPESQVYSFWLPTFLLWMVLAAGSAARINGVLYPRVVLPYRWVADFFPFSTLRSPDRFNLLLVFTLAVLTGYGVKRIGRRGWLLPLGLLMIVEFVPVPLLRWDLLPESPFFSEMRRDQREYGIIDYPMGYDESKLWLYYQTLHGKPSVEGHVSRYNPDLYGYLVTNSLLRALYKPIIARRPSLLLSEPFDNQVVPVPDLGPALRDLARHEVRYLLVHRSYLDAGVAAYVQQLLPFAPSHQDAVLAVYDLAAPSLVFYDDLPHTLSVAATLARFDVLPGPVEGAWQARIVARMDAPEAFPAQCEIRLAQGETVMTQVPVTLFPLLDSGENWQAGDFDYQIVDLDVLGLLPAGHYSWSFACGNGTPYLDLNILVVNEFGVTSYLRRSTEIILDDSIRLAGYRWHVEGAELRLGLWWEALATLDAELMVFVHLLDAEGQVVAQYDAIPCEWTCPTQIWQPHSLVPDRATLSLGALPDGTYSLAVGLYAPGSMQRTTAVEANGTVVTDGYIRLPDLLTLRWMRE
jgi:hypothetical protein